jgi:EmrB/QacA subfamily drug resistance transporter
MHGSTPWVTSAREGAGYPRRWWAMGVLSLALFVLGIDHTVLNTAIPRLALALKPSIGELLWIVDGYVIVFAGLLMLGGTIGDRLGRKHLLMIGIVIFGAGSALSAWAGSPWQLIIGRGIMGMGAAFIMPATLSTVTNMFPAAERTRAIAIWSAVPVIGLMVGPIVSGWLLEHFWFGSVFLINLPLVPLVLFGTMAVVPETRDESRPRIDWVGAILSFAGLVLLLYAIIEVSSRGWTDARVIGTGLAAAVIFAVFFRWEKRVDQPLLDLSLFRDARFSAASGSITLVFFAMAGMIFALSQYLQFVLGYSPLQAALRLLPVAVTSTVAALASTRLVDHLGRRIMVGGGLTLAALGFLVLSHVGDVGGYGIVAFSQCLLGLGIGCATAPATGSIMDAVPPAKAGVGSAVNDTTREVGGALGVAVLGSVLASLYSSGMTGAVRGLPGAAAAAARDSLPGAVEAARALGKGGAALGSAANAAFTSAMSTTLIVGAAVAMMGAVLAFVFVPGPRAAASSSADSGSTAATMATRQTAEDTGRSA